MLPDGRVLVIGGYGIGSLDSVLLYDPKAIPAVPKTPTDPRLVAGFLSALVLALATLAFAIPGVRRRLKVLRGDRQ
ncbi:MAG: hypothetical protein M3003_15690 [Candidatus Dormibacteraeota bacterium]|nr:hypothetical protein [Candidatus Dormibacteraeota bacterium]